MLERQKRIIDMFDDIAPTYDKANRIMSLGIDIKWRKEACKKAFEAFGEENIHTLLDVACGTGDMIAHWDRESALLNKSITHFIGIDPSSAMLEIAAHKLSGLLERQILRLECGEAKALNVDSATVDVLSIAYGLRNVVEIESALDEFVRVLKNGGVLVILDFMNDNANGIFDRIMRFYIRKILPFVGGFIAKNYRAYRYLPNSIEYFLSSKQLVSKLENRGMQTYFVKGYNAHISTLYIGIKCV